jgi:hypothetical protein
VTDSGSHAPLNSPLIVHRHSFLNLKCDFLVFKFFFHIQHLYRYTEAPAGGGDPDGTGVIIMYTNDFRDRADVARAGRALKQRFGKHQVGLYKSNPVDP